MKDFLGEFYGIFSFNYSFDSNKYIIHSNENLYILYEVNDKGNNSINYIDYYKLNFFNKIIINKYNSIYSNYSNSLYILFQKSKFEFNMKYLYNGKLFLNFNYINNWKNLWIKKVDYISSFYYRNIELFDNYIHDCFDYFIGLAECSIYLLNSIDVSNSIACISYIDYYNDDFCNPLNCKIDVAERNFSEYLRYLFYKDNYSYKSIFKLLYKYSNYYNYNLVLVRLIYPHVFFELLDCLYLKKSSGLVNIKDLIINTKKYEEFLHTLCLEMKKYQFIQIDI